MNADPPSRPVGQVAGPPHSPRAIALSNRLFTAALAILGGTYVLLIVAMLAADVIYMLRESWQSAAAAGTWPERFVRNPLVVALSDAEIQYSIRLSLLSSTLSAILSVVMAVPLGYVLSRQRFPGRALVDVVLDIPIVLPPLVIGLSLLILFQFPPCAWISRSVVYQVPAVVLAQLTVACAFAVRTMKTVFDQIDPRCEQVAITLGCSRVQAFGLVVLPEAGRGLLTAFTLAWARSLGEFGPILLFAGATRRKTEVLSTSIFLKMNKGDLEAALAVSLIMVLAAVVVLVLVRRYGVRNVLG